MRATLELVDRFCEYARQQLANGGTELTIDEVYDRWRAESECDETIRQVLQSVEQIERGETITIEELRNRHCPQVAPTRDVP